MQSLARSPQKPVMRENGEVIQLEKWRGNGGGKVC
jgi:hypothetical protein